MRVALVNHEYPPLAGGAGTATAAIASELAALGHDVLVVTSGTRACPRFEEQGRLQIVRVPSLRRSWGSPSAGELAGVFAGLAWQLPGLLRRFQPEGILAFFAIPSGWLAVREGRRLGVPVVVSLRGSDVPGFPGQRLGHWVRPLAHRLIRSTLQAAHLVVPNCPYLRELAIRFLPEIDDKTLVIGNGISPASVAQKPANSGCGELWLATVGQLIERKQTQLALQAVHDLTRTGIRTRLTVIGSGPCQAALERGARRLDIRDEVRFLGHVSRDEIGPILRRHDVYLLLSTGEGLSNAMLEAMAAGLPVITTDNGSHPVVEAAGCGVTVRRGDRQSLLVALQRLYCDEHLRCRLACAGLEFARTIPWRMSAEAFVQAFQALLAGRPAADEFPAAPVSAIQPALAELRSPYASPEGEGIAADVLSVT